MCLLVFAQKRRISLLPCIEESSSSFLYGFLDFFQDPASRIWSKQHPCVVSIKLFQKKNKTTFVCVRLVWPYGSCNVLQLRKTSLFFSPVGCSYKIHRLLLCRGVRRQEVSCLWHEIIWWWSSCPGAPKIVYYPFFVIISTSAPTRSVVPFKVQ